VEIAGRDWKESARYSCRGIGRQQLRRACVSVCFSPLGRMMRLLDQWWFRAGIQRCGIDRIDGIDWQRPVIQFPQHRAKIFAESKPNQTIVKQKRKTREESNENGSVSSKFSLSFLHLSQFDSVGIESAMAERRGRRGWGKGGRGFHRDLHQF